MSPEEIQELRVARLQELLDRKFHGKRVELGRALGHSSGAFVRQLLDRERPITEKTIIKLHALPGCAGWFGPVAPALPAKLSGEKSHAAVAHDVSYPKVETPPLTPWEDVMNLEKLPVVPSDLMVEVPDDALAARGLSKGQHVWFKARTTAEPRNVVLIEANGRRYIRRYAEDAQGPFAQALDDAYPSFREFKVVAVMHMRPAESI